jgi:signal peptide peptidase SppA
MRYPHLAARLYNTPLLIEPEKARVIEAILREGVRAEALDIAAQQEGFARRRPYRVSAGGIAVLPVLGTLVHRTLGLEAFSGLTSYQRLARLIADAAGDPEIRGVLLDLDSPGGESAGLFDLANAIAKTRSAKPVWAIANEVSFSAAYALASAAERLYTPATGRVGSIGVIALHLDRSERDAKLGLNYTAVIAGARKADYGEHAPLSGRARASLQGLVDQVYDVFVETVARNRRLEAAAVRGSEAGIFTAAEALSRGLVDGIASFDETLERLEAETARSRGAALAPGASHETRSESMTTENTEYLTPAEGNAVSLAEAREEGRRLGAEAERARVKAILEHPEAAERPKLAHQAIVAGLSTEQAAAVLSAAPKESAGGDGAFAQAMQALGNPAIDPDAGSDADEARAEVARIVSLVQPAG